MPCPTSDREDSETPTDNASLSFGPKRSNPEKAHDLDNEEAWNGIFQGCLRLEALAANCGTIVTFLAPLLEKPPRLR
jgi:hypothetical protein